MQSLLRWSIENSTPYDSAPGSAPPAPRADLNPEIIDLILGKPDAELMKEDMAVALDASLPDQTRLQALDHLEMLVEQIDNANNLGVLRLWEPLQHLLLSDQTSLDIKIAVLWVIGTALQNNPQAQDTYLTLQPSPLPTLLAFLLPPSAQTQTSLSARSKALYTISGLLKHNAPAVKLLDEVVNGTDLTGWQIISNALSDPEIQVRRKVVFMLNGLLVPTSSSPATTTTTSTSTSTSTPALTSTATQTPLPSSSTPTRTRADGQTVESQSQGLTLTFRPASQAGSANQSESRSLVAVHTSDSGPRTLEPSPFVDTSSSGPPPNVLTPESLETRPQDPIHPNSHSAHLRSPERARTSELTKAALEKYDIVGRVVHSVVEGEVWGEDGEFGGQGEGDKDFEEKAVRFVHTYVVLTRGVLLAEVKAQFLAWLDQQPVDEEGEGEGRVGLNVEEEKELRQALA